MHALGPSKQLAWPLNSALCENTIMKNDAITIKSALKRKKLANIILVPIFIVLAIASPLFPEFDVLSDIMGISGIIYFLILMSWLFVKCPSCGEFYFGSWQTTKKITNGCRVCGTQEFEKNT